VKSGLGQDERKVDQRVDSERPAARRRPLDVLRAIAAVRDDEISSLSWACLFVFSLLAGNYLIRPVRDEMGIAGGPDSLPALFGGTLLSMLAVWPLLANRLGRRPGASGLAPIFRSIQVALLGFYAAFRLVPGAGQVWAARAFFVWASISNLLIVSIAWGSLAGRFTSDQAHRLFGLIAAGGTLGAIAGSSLAGLLAVKAGPIWLMLLAAGFLEAGLLAAHRLLGSPDGPGPASPPPDESDPSRDAHQRRYMLGLGLWTLLFTTTSAIVYMEQARIVGASIDGAPARTAFFARIDWLVNVTGLILQVSLTGRILAWLGAGGSAALLPAITLGGAIVLALRPTVATVQWFQVARRAVDYAIARPSREVFYTVLGRAERTRTKGLIDTAIYRAGDAVGAWAYGLLVAIPGLSWAAPLGIVPLSIFWILVSLALGRALRRSESRAGGP
jgi:AAA family ATP:ADP antiporter